MDLQGRKVLVAGFGATGIAATRFLLDKGALVTISDNRKQIDIPEDIKRRGICVERGGHRVETFTAQNLIVVSPGVPLFTRAIIEARARGIEVISEIELAWRFLTAPVIAVTGTNGKTTTTSLLSALFQAAGKKVFTGGNIGTPLIEAVGQGAGYDYIIAEISSFQLEAVRDFKPFISILLNISEDHLDRYPSFDEYRYAKSRIFMNQDSADWAVINYDDRSVLQCASHTNAQLFYFSTSAAPAPGAYDDGTLNLSLWGRPALRLSVHNPHLPGLHNRENMLAAASAGYICAIPERILLETLQTFRSLPHRMEYVSNVSGADYYNDSKGTNVGSCVKSLQSLEGRVILIAGGRDKGGSYEPLRDLVEKKVKSMILIGEAAYRMEHDLGRYTETLIAEDLARAVREAGAKARPGDTVLFSPACSSFDMFDNYEQRGECFKKLVHALSQEQDGLFNTESGTT
jgi:UDP-N-acetylmuramoylalanine--D-glutamate ligase